MAVPKFRKHTGKRSLRILSLVAVCLVSLFLAVNEQYSVSVDDQYSLTTLLMSRATTSSDTYSFVKLEQQAKAKQDEFCHRLQENKVEVPMLERQGKFFPMETTELHINETDGRQNFIIEVYDRDDIVSGEVKNEGWDMQKVIMITQSLKDYASQHNIPLSEVTFVDIGANVGWFTLNMAALGVNVYAFEPMEENLYLLRKSLCHPENKNLRERVHLFDVGLSNVAQTCIITSHIINVGDGHTFCVKVPATYKAPEGYKIRGQIKVDRIDNYLSAADKHIAVVKMDTEGYEAHVVQGGPNFFFKSKIPFIFSEYAPLMILNKGGNGLAFMKGFLDAGYGVKSEDNVEYSREQLMDRKNFKGVHDILFEYKEQYVQ